MRKFSKVLAMLCVVALVVTALSCTAFAASPSSYTNDGRNLAVIANGDVNIYGDAMYIEGSVYSNGTIYCGDGQGNKIDGIFISGTENTVFGSDDLNNEWTQYRTAEGFVHVNDEGTTDGIGYYSTQPEFNGAILDKNTSFECSYVPAAVPTIANNLGTVEANVYGSDARSWGGADTTARTISEDTKFDELYIAGDALKIDLSNGDVTVVIDSLKVGSSTPYIDIIGTEGNNNKAYIYVKSYTGVTNLQMGVNVGDNKWDWRIFSAPGDDAQANEYLDLMGDKDRVDFHISNGDNPVILDHSKIAANVYIDSADAQIKGTTWIDGNVTTNAEVLNVSDGATYVRGVVCAPNADTDVVNSATIFGQLHTDTLTINGAGRIIYRPDTIPPTKFDDPVTPAETAKPEGEPAYIVRYVVATGEYSRGTMDTKMHKPARGLNAEGLQEEELEYEVLDENTYKITGPQEVSQEIKDRVQLILNTTNDVFVQRGSEGLLQRERFGRIDSNGTDMSLSITPYAYPQMSDVINTMYLCWGDRDSQVETVWYVIPEELR